MKRGQLSILLVLIILIISLVIMIYILGMFWAPWSRTVIDDTLCKFSVMLKGISKSPDLAVLEKVPVVGKGFGGNSPFDLKCKMHDLKVVKKNNEAYVDVRYGEDVELVKGISDEVANCWWRFGEGKYDFYSDVSYDFWKNNRMCFLCARFKGDGSLDLNKLFNFMRNNYYKKGFNEITYSDYVTGTGSYQGNYDKVGDGFLIDDDNDLYVVFIVDKQEPGMKRIGTLFVNMGIAGTVLGVVAKNPFAAVFGMVAGGVKSIFEKEGYNAAIILASADQVNGVCDKYA